MTLAALAWTACAQYQPASEGFIQSVPTETAGASRDSKPLLNVPPLDAVASPFDAAPIGDTELDLPANPAVWGERAERAVGRKFAPVYFDFDSSELRPATRRALEDYSEWLQKNPGVWVTLEGHCDSAGSHEYNYNLGMLRAQEVKLHLASAGTPQDHLFVISYGEERKAIEETTPEEAALNRRVEFRAFRAPAGYAVPPSSTAPGAPPETKEPELAPSEASDLP